MKLRVITVKKILEDKKEQDKKWVNQAPIPDDFPVILDDDVDTRVVDENGNMILTILRGVMPKQMTLDYYDAIVNGKAIQKTENRANAAGLKRKKRLKQDGTVSKTAITDGEVESSIIGFFDRYPRTNYCRKTAWTLANPENWERVVKCTDFVSRQYKEKCPDEFKAHHETTRKASPDFVIDGEVFSTITLNRNLRTFYHRDAGNLQEGFAAMSYMKTGKFNGGEIGFPNYGCAVKMKNFDLIIFKNTEIHGNLEIKPANDTSKYQRITSVFFFRQNILYCGTADDELNRAKRNKGDQIIGSTKEDLNKGRWE